MAQQERVYLTGSDHDDVMRRMAQLPEFAALNRQRVQKRKWELYPAQMERASKIRRVTKGLQAGDDQAMQLFKPEIYEVLPRLYKWRKTRKRWDAKEKLPMSVEDGQTLANYVATVIQGRQNMFNDLPDNKSKMRYILNLQQRGVQTHEGVRTWEQVLKPYRDDYTPPAYDPNWKFDASDPVLALYLEQAKAFGAPFEAEYESHVAIKKGLEQEPSWF